MNASFNFRGNQISVSRLDVRLLTNITSQIPFSGHIFLPFYVGIPWLIWLTVLAKSETGVIPLEWFDKQIAAGLCVDKESTVCLSGRFSKYALLCTPNAWLNVKTNILSFILLHVSDRSVFLRKKDIASRSYGDSSVYLCVAVFCECWQKNIDKDNIR